LIGITILHDGDVAMLLDGGRRRQRGRSASR